MKYSTDLYKSDWDKVAEDESKGLPKSALEKVNTIYKKAKDNNNPSQFIKSVLYKVKYIGQVEEDAFAKAIEELQKETNSSTSYAKPLLHSILGEVYWQYYNNNRYYILQRTKTNQFKQTDLRTWDATKLIEATIAEYTESIKEIETTKKIKIEDFRSILNHDPEYVPTGRNLRPTLYDFLAHRAVDFFSGQEHGIAKPAETFILDNPIYLSDIKEFVKIKIETKDQMAYKYYALQILQDLAKYHMEDNDPAALAEIELKRLSFVYNHAVFENKGSLYLKSLETMAARFSNSPISTDVYHAIATYWHSLAHKYYSQPTDENKWVSKKAYDICESAIKKFPNSDGAQNCKALQSQIKSKSVTLTMEKTNIASKPFLSLINYKNLDTLYFRIYKINRSKINEIKKEFSEYYNKHKAYKYYDEILISRFAKEDPDKSFSIKLPNDKDYMEHRVEVKIPELDFGQYVLFASTDKAMTLNAQSISYAFTNISNLTYIENIRPNQDLEYYVLNRATGEVVSEAEVNTYYQIYNNKKSRYEINADRSITTDKSGFFTLKAKKEYKYFYMTLRKGNDFLEPIDDYYNGDFYRQMPLYQNPNYKEGNYKTVTAKLFLDRAIYRPGQIIYYKGILIESNDKKRSIQTNVPVTVTFYNVNYQQVAQQTVTTNEYGTFSGSFTAPTNVLNGQMSINTSYNGNVYFSVEDYKRPKFAVEFEKVKGVYRLGDKVKIKGFAKAFSGANIDGAEVKYRVVRNARYPYWWGYSRWFNPSPQMEIKQGVLKTDEKGYFEVEFEAIPDPSVPKEPGISFSYQVNADITDLNGETRSASGFAYVGYTSLIVNINVPEMVNLTHESPFEISTMNLNGEFEPSQGYITIHKLKSPAHAYRRKMWQKPDKFIISKNDYVKDFPNEVYDKEDDVSTWEKEKEVLNTPFNTEKEKNLTLKNLSKWLTGRYVLEIKSLDKFGSEAKEIKYFTVFSENTKDPIPTPTYNWKLSIKTVGEPGETARFILGSTESVKILYELELDKKIITREWMSFENSQKQIEIPIKEEYRGNIYAHFVLVKDNQIFTSSEQITVPYTNKELKLSFETFRNKLQPGEKEEWRIKIQGAKKEKVISEMLATLYDASLDMFRKNYWDFSIYPYNYSSSNWQNRNDFNIENFRQFQRDWNVASYGISKSYDYLNWFGLYLYGFRGYYPYQTRSVRSYRNGRRDKEAEVEYDLDDAPMAEERAAPAPAMAQAAPVATGGVNKKSAMRKESFAADAPGEAGPELKEKAESTSSNTNNQSNSGGNGEISGVKARTNFNETAFFLPHLISDKNGEVTVSFTIPEALTKWRMMGLAHTKDLKYGFIYNELVTQKELMVVPNAPRFFREGDEMEFTAKITNLSDKKMSGKAQIEFFDAITLKPILHGNILKTEKLQSFESEKGQSTVVKWNLKVPEGLQAISYRVLAQSDNFSDGEEMPLPVLTNRMLVTETLPLPMRGKDPKNFKLEKMISNKSDTLVHHKYTLEFTSNPAWYAVQALPYIMEYPYECAEQLFSRFYANSLASHIANANPKIKKIFESWKLAAVSNKEDNSKALLSNLEKNQELKSLMLEETPWVLDAQDETERKKRVGLLFDLAKMSDELERALTKLMKVQSSNGGFAWFNGMPENRYITQHIVTGLGHLDHLGVKRVRENANAWNMTTKAVQYLDWQFKEDYDRLIMLEKRDNLNMSSQQIWYLQIQYLYARSFFKDVPMPNETKEAFEYYKWQAKTYWTSFLGNKMSTGMIALALNRLGEETPDAFTKALSSHKLKDFKSNKTPEQIVKSLREHSLNSDEMGMYWKQGWGYFWYELPIETQSLMIEVFDEVAKDEDAVNDLKTWLLKQKQTQDWKTTKATSEAIYALLLKGEDWLQTDRSVEIQLGSKKINPSEDKDINLEAGTGYFKKAWNGSEISNDMGNITVTPKNNTLKTKNAGVSWGAVYWQYFEQLDKITPADTPLKLEKKLFLQENTKTGPVITPIDNKTKLKPGDLIKVRIELRVDRDMEFVHMKDMRAASFEPTNVISRYKWQDGLGYYESTRDAATNFFFDSLPKGTYVFEYPLRVTHKGNYSNGITTIQCMYAPEFSSHSEGVRVKVGE